MTITVQDGTGLVAGANSYASVADAETYWTDRNVEDFADADTEVKEAALISATDYIDTLYFGRIKGQRLTATQTTEFPRTKLYDAIGTDVSSTIPDKLKEAVYELAKATVVDGLASFYVTSTGTANNLLKSRIKAGAVEIEEQYQHGGAATNSLPKANALLREFVLINEALRG